MQLLGNHIQATILRGIAERAGLPRADRQETFLIVESLRSDDWASATFVGASHDFELRLQGAATAVAEALAALAGLPEHDFNIPGHILADITCTPGPLVIADDLVYVSLTVNALTIVD